MIKKKEIWVIPNEDEVSPEKCSVVLRKLVGRTTHDEELERIRNQYQLEIPFLESSNHLIDYGICGYVVIFFLEKMILMSIPSALSFQQYTVLNSLKEEVEENELYLYSFAKKNSSEMHLLYRKDPEESNRVFLEKILESKKNFATSSISEQGRSSNIYQKY